MFEKYGSIPASENWRMAGWLDGGRVPQQWVVNVGVNVGKNLFPRWSNGKTRACGGEKSMLV